MREDYELLYKDMLKDIERCWGLELPATERAEKCFWIAYDYADRLKAHVKDGLFNSESEEIDFFRNVKPQFTKYKEFYIILSESFMFVPDDHHSGIKFWEDELKRYKRFCEKNELFVSYYESGQRYHDSIYFARKHYDQRLGPMAPIYDMDIEYLTSYDPLVRSYEAHKMYFEFAKERKEELSRKGSVPIND